nr:hypothetical protein [Tanacetum cinerariifolium]
MLTNNPLNDPLPNPTRIGDGDFSPAVLTDPDNKMKQQRRIQRRKVPLEGQGKSHWKVKESAIGRHNLSVGTERRENGRTSPFC